MKKSKENFQKVILILFFGPFPAGAFLSGFIAAGTKPVFNFLTAFFTGRTSANLTHNRASFRHYL